MEGRRRLFFLGGLCRELISLAGKFKFGRAGDHEMMRGGCEGEEMSAIFQSVKE